MDQKGKTQWNVVARMRKAYSARCGHVKRRIMDEKPLTGKTRNFALELLGSCRGYSNDAFLQEVAIKLGKGIPLTEYEAHIVVDVILVHSKIKGEL